MDFSQQTESKNSQQKYARLNELFSFLSRGITLSSKDQMDLKEIAQICKIIDYRKGSPKCNLCWGKGYVINNIDRNRTEMACKCVVKYYQKKSDPQFIYLNPNEYDFLTQAIKFYKDRNELESTIDPVSPEMNQTNYRVLAEHENEKEIYFELVREEKEFIDEEVKSFINSKIKDKNGNQIGHIIAADKRDKYTVEVKALISQENSNEEESETE